jgi:hypothetical protein
MKRLLLALLLHAQWHICDSLVTCSAGSYYNGTVCATCPAGTYTNSNVTTGTAYNCTSCGAGQYSTVLGATAAATCTQCGTGAYTAVRLEHSCGVTGTAACDTLQSLIIMVVS